MRLRRLCERKKTGRLNVSEASHNDYVAAGERREVLELALLETLDKVGLDAGREEVRKEFNQRVEYVKERLHEREKEITGEWLTKERMISKLGYTKHLVEENNSRLFVRSLPWTLIRFGTPIGIYKIYIYIYCPSVDG